MEKDILGPLFRPGPVRDQTLNPKRVLDFQNKRQKDLAGGKEISTWLKEDNDKVQSALARGRERLKVAEQSKSKPKWMVEDDNNNDRKCLEVLRKMVYQAVLWRTWYSA